MDGSTNKLDLTVVLTDHFEGGRAEAAKIVVENANAEQVKEQAWDLVSMLCGYLTAEQEAEKQTVVMAAEHILLHLTTVANVKELLVVLLEQADTHKDDVKFKGLLTPIQQCLIKLPGKKRHSVAIAMETLYAHLKSLPLPEEQMLEEEKIIFLDLDKDIQRCNDVVAAFLTFVEPLVAEFHWQKRTTCPEDQVQQLTKVAKDLSRYLIKVLDHPVAYLDLSHRKPTEEAKHPPVKSTSRVCAEKLLHLLAQLNSNFPKMVFDFAEEDLMIEKRKIQIEKQKETAEKNEEHFDDLENYDVEEVNPMLGLSVFSFLAFGEITEPDSLPQVFTHDFILNMNGEYIALMLSQKETLVVAKGLSLFSSLISRLENNTLQPEIFEMPGAKDLIQELLHVMTTCKVREMGQTAVSILKTVLNKFDIPGRNLLLFLIMNMTSHTGVMALVTNLLKDEIDANLKRPVPDCYFVGKKLKRLFNVVFSLPRGEKTDILEQSERIMGALNLLRYLVIRDKPADNRTGIWDQVPHIQDKYCEVLRKGINLSRAHFDLEIKKLNETKKGQKMPEITFNVNNRDLDGMSKSQQLQVLEMAKHTFDMMESILGRVTEIISQQKKEATK